ncbi:MAG: zinc-dependent alcohol dehydrogenase family protein [Planctomycetes bacterium]|nr:zinc-dependent alcohol dehydrogenase family protein [Planctomycetota bacterium]
MKAMLLHDARPADHDSLVESDVATPKPGHGSLLVRVRACGVCRTDLHIVEGELPLHRRPLIPGHEIVGTVAQTGAGATRFAVGQRIGVAWLHRACATCGFCAAGRENLCEAADFTGWTVDGGYAEYVTVPESFAYAIPDRFSDEQAAPLLCAGIIGYRALKLTGIGPGQRLGLYGFGGSAHLALQIARYWNCEPFVVTRSEKGRALARQLGAAWAGGPDDPPPERFDAAVVFAPAGPIVAQALSSLAKGGTVVLAGIYMTTIPPLDYAAHLYHEKTLRSAANATRRDGEELLEAAAEVPVRTVTTAYPLHEANRALLDLKTGRLRGAAVLTVA